MTRSAEVCPKRLEVQSITITFPPGERLSRYPDCIAFTAICDGSAIACRITFEALSSMPGARVRDFLTTFQIHRSVIEKTAMQLLQNGRSRGGQLAILNRDLEAG